MTIGDIRIIAPVKARILYKPSRYKGLWGGRGGAKSTSVADALIIRGVQRSTRWLCSREIQKSLRTSVHQLLIDRINALELNNAYTITERSITGPNRTEFLFAGLRTNPDSIKSMEGLDGAWVEEADRCSQKSLDLIIPTVRKDGSELWFTWNRFSEKDPVDSMFLGGIPPPGSLVAEMSWRDNPWFPEVLRTEMEWLKKRNRDKWMHVWEGHPQNRSDAIVFNNWTEDDLDLEVPDGTVARFGADWGMRDPTVLIKIYNWENTLYIAREVYKVGATIDETPSLFAGSDVRDLPRWDNKAGHPGITGVMNGNIVADSSYPQTIRYLRDRGFSIKGAIKGAGSVEEGVEFMQTMDIIVNPSCTHCIDELSQYSYKVDPLTDDVLPEFADKDNHIIDSIRYAQEGERRAAGKKSRVATFIDTIQLGV